MTDLLARFRITGQVPHHSKGRSGFVLVPVNGLEAVFTSQFKGCREAGEYDFGNHVAAADEVREYFDVSLVADDRREAWIRLSDLVSGHLKNLVAILGAVQHAGMVADWLVACNRLAVGAKDGGGRSYPCSRDRRPISFFSSSDE